VDHWALLVGEPHASLRSSWLQTLPALSFGPFRTRSLPSCRSSPSVVAVGKRCPNTNFVPDRALPLRRQAARPALCLARRAARRPPAVCTAPPSSSRRALIDDPILSDAGAPAFFCPLRRTSRRQRAARCSARRHRVSSSPRSRSWRAHGSNGHEPQRGSHRASRLASANRRALQFDHFIFSKNLRSSAAEERIRPWSARAPSTSRLPHPVVERGGAHLLSRSAPGLENRRCFG